MEKIIDVAQYLCTAYKNMIGEQIDEMKLHKLLYFAQRESLAILNEPLFAGDFEGWKYGPVCREIWHCFRQEGLKKVADDVSEECRYLVNNVILEYGSMAAAKLCELSYREKSWLNARQGLKDGEECTKKLSLDDIREDARKVRPYDYVWDMYYDEFDDAEEPE
mgnify:CR=1 FL=1